MNSSDPVDGSAEFSLELHRQIDQICDAFESSFQRNEQPRIEDYLKHELGAVDLQLFELIMVELAYRKKFGEAPSFDEYAIRFPSHRDALSKLTEHFDDSTIVEHRTSSATGLIPPPPIDGLDSYTFLGSGSFGSVWKAWDRRLRRFVAVKTPISTELTEKERTVIQREAHIVARTKHPHVVQVHRAGEEGGQVYIVYEYVAGQTLQAYQRLNGPWPARRAAEICRRVAEAIHHVHELGIIHRDLKPANILIDDQGEPFVMDFGLARLIGSASTIGSPGVVLGTVAYMSPEQAAGRASEADARSDIYSLGSILYEMVCGHPVFRGTLPEVMDQVLHTEPTPLLVREPIPNGAADHPLAIICRKCLEKEKSDRYQTAADLAKDLQRYLNGEPVVIPKTSALVKLWRRIGRFWPLIGFLIALPLIGVLSFQLLGRSSENSAAARVINVTTEPEGAFVSIIPCDPKTGEPELTSGIVLQGAAPGKISLSPGRYRVHATLVEPKGMRFLQVHRTVPGLNGSWPSMAVPWDRSELLPTGELKWPPLYFLDIPPSMEMAYIPGTDHFVVEGPSGARTCSVLPFYVSTREFTFGDFLTIRPGMRGDVAGRPAMNQPPGNTMPCRYDRAENWAEESGARLLTDLEFAWLAHLASEAQGKRSLAGEEASHFDESGGTIFDEIPTEPPVRGVLTGYAEWTSTWVNSPLATVSVAKDVDAPDQPQLYRIIRGGTIRSRPEDYPRKMSEASGGRIFDSYPHVGFRLALTPPPIVTKKGSP